MLENAPPARTDSLTACRTAQMIPTGFRQMQARAAPSGTETRPCSSALDGFKRSTTASGHAAGDQLLKAVASGPHDLARGDTIAGSEVKSCRDRRGQRFTHGVSGPRLVAERLRKSCASRSTSIARRLPEKSRSTASIGCPRQRIRPPTSSSDAHRVEKPGRAATGTSVRREMQAAVRGTVPLELTCAGPSRSKEASTT